MTRARFTGQCLTLEQYRQLEADGKIDRPLTDAPLGTTSAPRRSADATNSAAVTETEAAIPWQLDPDLPRLADHDQARNAAIAARFARSAARRAEGHENRNRALERLERNTANKTGDDRANLERTEPT